VSDERIHSTLGLVSILIGDCHVDTAFHPLWDGKMSYEYSAFGLSSSKWSWWM